MITAYVPGVFDMLHIGHIRIFERAREYCDELIAGVVTDEVAEQAKGRRPIVCYEERAAIVSSLRAVDWCDQVHICSGGVDQGWNIHRHKIRLAK